MLSMCATIFITSGIGLQRARRFGFRVIFVGRSLSPGSGGASPYRRPALKGSEVLRGPCRLRGSATYQQRIRPGNGLTLPGAVLYYRLSVYVLVFSSTSVARKLTDSCELREENS